MMGLRVHTHLADELQASAWLSKDELLLHLGDYHGMLIGPVGKTTETLAQIHIDEHEEDSGPLTPWDTYDSTPPRGTGPAWTRVYRKGGRMAHLRKEDGSGDIACEGPLSRQDGRDDHWLGTGSQAEYDRAARLPLHPACFSVREAAWTGIDADQADPDERGRQL